jgi:hypothetical protein
VVARRFTSPGAYRWRVVEDLQSPAFQPPLEPRCSAKGCRAPACWALRWNNPKLHTSEHRKTWLACDEHRQHLSSFLDLRGFLREVAPFGTAPDAHIS